MTPARNHDSVRPRMLVAAIIALAALCLLIASPAAHGQPKSPKPAPAAERKPPEGIDAEKLFGAIVKVSAHAVPGARSSATLGDEREGSGVVIGDNGLILTIGYLIVEAEDVNIVDSKGRTLAARIIGYDHATGFGLLRTISPFDAKPVAFGDSGKVVEREPVMIASSGDDNVSFAYIVSKRGFSGNWEYALEQALYTSPPTPQIPRATESGPSAGHGALMIADTSRANVRCTTVGVPNALSDAAVARWRLSARRVMTTNCRPMSAPPDDPTMT